MKKKQFLTVALFKWHALSRIVLLSFFFSLPITSLAAELSLQDAILLALRYNPEVNDAQIQRVIDKFNLRLAKNSYEVQYALEGNANYTVSTASGEHGTQRNYSLVPSTHYLSPIGTQLSFNLNNAITHNDGGRGAHYNPTATLSATQPLLRGFGTSVTLAPLYNAYDNEQIAKLRLKQTIINTITQVISAYTVLVQAQNTLLTEKLALQASQAKVNEQQQLIRAGKVAPADVVQFKADVANQLLAIESLQNTIDQAQLQLITTLGLNPAIKITVPEKVVMPMMHLPSLSESIAIALRNNTEYQQLLFNYRVLQRNLLLQHDQQQWQLDLMMSGTAGGGSGGGGNAGITSLTNGKNKSASVGLQLSVPIHDLQRQSGLVQAKVDLDKAKIDLDAAKRQVETDVRNSYDNLQSQQAQIQQAKESLKLADDNLRIANIKLNFGKVTPFEVSSLQSALTDAQIAVIAAEIAYDNAIASFDQVLGITLQRWQIHIRY